MKSAGERQPMEVDDDAADTSSLKRRLRSGRRKSVPVDVNGNGHGNGASDDEEPPVNDVAHRTKRKPRRKSDAPPDADRLRDVPFEERVGSRRKRAANEQQSAGQASVPMPTVAAPDGSVGPSSSAADASGAEKSLVVLLAQALQSGDKTKLDTLLRVDDAAAVEATVRQLAVPLVLSLLREIDARLPLKKDGRTLLRWLHLTLAAHTSYLTALPDLREQLGTLHEWMAARARHSSRLLALQGKLQLLQAHVERRRNPRALGRQPPRVVFQEESDSGSDDDGGSELAPTTSDGGGASSGDDDALGLDWWNDAAENSSDGEESADERRPPSHRSSSGDDDDDDQLFGGGGGGDDEHDDEEEDMQTD